MYASSACCSDERAQNSSAGKGAESDRQQQVPEAKQTAARSRHAATKATSQSMAMAHAKQKPSLSLQARTGVLPYTGSHSQADMPPGQCFSGPQSWYSTTGSAVVREAIKVGLPCLCETLKRDSHAFHSHRCDNFWCNICIYQHTDPPMSRTLTSHGLLHEFAIHTHHLLAAAVLVMLICAGMVSLLYQIQMLHGCRC